MINILIMEEGITVFNIVLFHIGVYDETQSGYKLLYKKFYDSVLREFKDDNIIVIHNYNECFEKFPKIKYFIDKYFSEFYNTSNDQLKCDLLRMLLCIFLKDYLYIDSDIYILQGFREILLETINKTENKNKLFFNIEKDTIAIFYSKRYFKKFNVYLKLFALNNYKYDAKALKDSNFYSLNEVYCDGDNGYKVCDKKLHYGCMLYMTHCMTHDHYIEYIGEDHFNDIAANNRRVLCHIPQQKICVLSSDINTTYVYFIQNDVELEDILDTFNIKHEKVNINKMQFDFNCLYPQGALWITYDSFNNEIELKRCLWHKPYEKISIENYLKIDDIIQYSIDHEYNEGDCTISEGEKIKCHQKCVLPKSIKNVSVSISHACNLNCYHCYFDGNHYDTPEMKKAYFDTLYKIKGHQLDKILLTDNGEPFIYYDEILEYIQSLSQNDTKCIEITTNLTLLNKEKIVKLYKAITMANIDYRFIVSLDGITKETFEAARIGANWEQVINNLKTLISLFGNEKIVVSYVIRKPALKDAPFARSFFRKKFGLKTDIYYDYYDNVCQKYFLSLEDKELENLK